MKKYSIAIDGPAASGKSSTAQEVAKKLGFQRIDSGSIYRALTYLVIKEFGSLNLDMQNEKVKKFIEELEIVQRKTKTFGNGIDITDHLKTLEIDKNVGTIAKELYVRNKTFKIQREAIDEAERGIVIDGRDIGTIVIPEAFLKLFVTAKDTTRAKRRSKQTGEDYDKVLEELRIRDFNDINREHGQLKVAEDSIIIENDDMTMEEIVDLIFKIFNERMKKENDY